MLAGRCIRSRPSHGRGPNAAYHERIIANETNRARWYPAPGAYLACVRRAFVITDAGGNISLGWTDAAGHDREAWRREFRRALHARINAKGGNHYSRYNDPSQRGIAPEYRRDRQRLTEIDQRVRVYKFETRTVHQRFADRLASYVD